MRPSRTLLRSGGHRRGDLWTSGKRTTLHHPELYDQMVVAQQEDEQRMRTDATTPADVARMKSMARLNREHYRGSMEAMGVQGETVNNSTGPILTSRPSYLGPTILSGAAGESANARELDVGFGIRKDQFTYYDDTGRRLQHPTSAQMMANAGLATAEELSARLEAEYKKALGLEGGTQGALGDGQRAIGGKGEEVHGAIEDGSTTRLTGADESLSAEGAMTTIRGDGIVGTNSAAVKGVARPMPSPEVAAMTTVHDKRDLLYNQKLRPHWEAAQADPVRGSSFRGPRRSIDTGGVVTRGTEVTNIADYYDNATTVGRSGNIVGFGAGVAPSAHGAGHDAYGNLKHSGNVIRAGEEAFRQSMLHRKQQQQPGGEEDGAGSELARTAAAAPPAATPPPTRPLSSAEKDPKYASQRVDENNPRVGPEFFKGADIAMDADLRKALDVRRRAVREGKAAPSVASILGDAALKDGFTAEDALGANPSAGAIRDRQLDAMVEDLLDEREAAKRRKASEESERSADVNGSATHTDNGGAPHKANTVPPRRTPKPNTVKPKSAPASSWWERFVGIDAAEATATPDAAGAQQQQQQQGQQQQQQQEDDPFMGNDRERQEAAERLQDETLNARLGIRNIRANTNNSASGRRNPVTYESASSSSLDSMMLKIIGAGIELNLPTGNDSRELFRGGFDFNGNRRKGANSYTESANTGGRFANRLSPNYFNNDNLHAGMMASSKHHSTFGGQSGDASYEADISAAAARNKAFSAFQRQAKEDPYGAARNIGVGAGGISAISEAQASGGAGVGSSFSHSEEGQKAMNQFQFRQALKQLDHSRMQPTNHQDMYGDCLKYLEAYIDMSGVLGAGDDQGSAVNVAESNDSTADVLMPRAALKGRLVGVLFYTDTERCREFLERLERFHEPYKGDLVILGISYGSYERRDLMRRHRFCYVPPNMGSRFIARDAGFKGSWWSPFPVLYILDGSSGRIISHFGYAAVMRNPQRCVLDWVRGEQGASPVDIALARFNMLCEPAPTNKMAARVMSDFGLRGDGHQ